MFPVSHTEWGSSLSPVLVLLSSPKEPEADQCWDDVTLSPPILALCIFRLPTGAGSSAVLGLGTYLLPCSAKGLPEAASKPPCCAGIAHPARGWPGAIPLVGQVAAAPGRTWLGAVPLGNPCPARSLLTAASQMGQFLASPLLDNRSLLGTRFAGSCLS